MDLKTLLDEKADEMRLGPRIPSSVLRRARRRRAGTAALAGAVTVGLALGAVVGARALLVETTPGSEDEIRRGPGGATEEFYPFIYPPTQEELEVTKEQVAQGSMPMWTDPEGTAILFAVNVLGWDMNDVEVDVRGDDPITAVITNPSLAEAAGAQGDIRTQLQLLRLPDEPEMYVVLAAEAELIEIEPARPDHSLAFRGRVGFVPPGGEVVLNVRDGGERVARTVLRQDGRFEVEVPGRRGPAMRISVALTDGTGVILTLTAAHVAVASAEPVPIVPEQDEQLPPPVAATRAAILDAAAARDWEALRALIPEEGLTFTFGGSEGPITYWQQLEQEGTTVLPTLETLLERTTARASRGVFIWPEQAVEDPRNWDDKDRILLRLIHTDREIRSFARFGSYLGWRVGIDRDGTWMFFVAGD